MASFHKNTHENQTAGLFGGLLSPIVQPLLRWAHEKGWTGGP